MAMARRALATASLAAAIAPGLAKLPACDLTKSGNEMCDDFCNHRCGGFFNTSRGETGDVQRVSFYRLTPANVTGLRNKDLGDAPGDIGYWLSHKNMSAQCARDPTSYGCLLDGKNLYGKFTIEFDGQWGPYLQCNPLQLGGPDPMRKPVWVDDSNFLCGQDCLAPTATGCHTPFPLEPENTTNDGAYGPKCFCDGTDRQHLTVGRAEPTFLDSGSGFGPPGVPASWVPQCQTGYKKAPHGQCLSGRVSQELQAWSFDAAVTMACEACRVDPECSGWNSKDNRTVQLFRGNLTTSAGSCTGVTAEMTPWSKQKNWFGAGALGGLWYSTPVAGECPEGAPLGTNGCTWRQVASVYKNASCVGLKVDASVEHFGSACFGLCTQPLNVTSECYLNCYRDLLMGNAATNVTKIPKHKIVDPWVLAFAEVEPSKGGCPEVVPPKCNGLQCDPLLQSSRLSIVV